MARKRYTTEQIICKLREAEIELASGLTTTQVCKKLGITDQTYYRWRKEYGGLRVDQAKNDPPPVVVPSSKLEHTPFPTGGAERSSTVVLEDPSRYVTLNWAVPFN